MSERDDMDNPNLGEHGDGDKPAESQPARRDGAGGEAVAVGGTVPRWVKLAAVPLLVVGALAWPIWWAMGRQSQAGTIRRLRKRGAYVETTVELPGWAKRFQWLREQVEARPDASAWLFEEVTVVDMRDARFTDEDLHELRTFDDLVALRLAGASITDRGCRHLSELTGLEWLFILDAPVTDEALAHLRGLANLRVVRLSGTQVRGPGLAHLAALPHLHELVLSRTPVDDSAVLLLKGAAELETLDILGTQVTMDGYTAFRVAMPKVTVLGP